LQSVAKRQKKKAAKAQAAKASQGSRSNVHPAAHPKPVSGTTKAQLGAFAFQKPPKPDQAKQEGSHAENRSTDVPELLQGRFTSPEKESCKDPPSKDCPQTPAPRLALEDLVGFGEGGQQPLFNIAPDVSPEERIVWQVSPRGTPSAITPASKRQKRIKRARSSSPIVGPLSKNISPQIHPDPKTPHADPVNDVWQRYSSINSGPRSRNPPGVPLRLFSAEKRDSLNLSPLGLRRAYSCGSDWPPTSIKRRKPGSTESYSPEGEEGMEKIIEEGANLVLQPIAPARRGEGKSKLSRVSMLLSKVHEKLAKGSTGPEDKSSSPPSSLNSGVYDMPSSPTLTATSRRPNQGVMPPKERISAYQDVSDGDEYDDGFDNDIDLEMLGKVEEVVVAFTQKQQQLSQRNGKQYVNDTEQNNSAIAQKASDIDEFEFGDDDNALDYIDVDALLSQQPGALSSKAVPPCTPKQQKPVVPIPAQGATDVVEEFRDIDFGDWDDEGLDCVVRMNTPASEGSPNCLKAGINSGTMRRFVVLETSEGAWERRGNRQPQKV